MEKIEQQEALIEELTTRRTIDVSHDVGMIRDRK